MTAPDPIVEALDAFVPTFDEPENRWAAVLDAASVGRRREPRRFRLRLPRSRRALVAVAFLLILLGVGSAVAAVKIAGDGSPVQFAPTTGSTPSLGSDAASIIATVEARVPDVLSIRITTDAIPNGDGKGTTDYRIAHIDVAAPADDGPAVARATWESNLVVGALFTAFTQADLAPPVSDELTLVLPNGRRDDVGGGLGKVVPNQVFDPVTPELEARIERNAAAQRFGGVAVSTYPVVNDVIEIHATTPNAPAAAAARFFKAHGLEGLLGESGNDFEGVYFELDDANGNPLLIESTAPRAGAGGYWAAPATGIEGDRLRR